MSVNTPTRILDKPEVEEPQDNDYILIDNATEGTRRISIENLTGGINNGQTNNRLS